MVAPLVWLPGAFVMFVFPKLALFTVAMMLGALAVPRGRLPTAIRACLVAGFLVFLVAAVASSTPMASLAGRWPRYEGLPVLAIYAGLVWLGARLGLRASLIQSMNWSSSALAVLSIVEAAGVSVVGNETGRSGSVLGNATDQGLVALMMFSVLLAALLERRNALLALGVGASLATVVLSGSRACLAGVGVVLVTFALMSARRHLTTLASAGLATAVLAASIPQMRERLFLGHTVSGRSILWQESWDLAHQHLLFGVGPSRYVDTIGAMHDQRWIDAVGVTNPPDSPHSWPLQLLLAGGIPLLVIGLVAAGLVLHLGFRAARADARLVGIFAAVVAYGTVLSVNFTIASSTGLAALLIGVLVSAPPRAERRGSRRLAVATAAVLAVGMTTAAAAEIPLKQGVERAEHGDLGGADAAFSTARHLRPFDADISMLAAQAFAGLASEGVDPQLAETYARRSLRGTPDAYQSLVALGVSLNAQEMPGLAMRALDRATELEPTQPSAYVQRAISFYLVGETDAAVNDLYHALDLDENDPTAARLLAAIGS